MEFRSYDMELREAVRKPSPGRCIYCGDHQSELTHEHVIPYSLGANTTIFEKASCVPCAQTIQRYEQHVLRDQLIAFRTRIEAPTRKPRNRPTHQDIHFMEVDKSGRQIRDLGVRKFAIEDTPLSLSLWQLAPPRILGENHAEREHIGQPWVSLNQIPSQRELVSRIAATVAEETQSVHVAMKINHINREHFLRFLAKTAHAYAVFEKGLDAFRPLTTDLILGRNNDLAQLVGGSPINPSFDSAAENTIEMSLGVVENGPAAGHTAVYIRLYPMLNTPAYIVIVGAPL